jgi:hypothetical protein
MRDDYVDATLSHFGRLSNCGDLHRHFSDIVGLLSTHDSNANSGPVNVRDAPWGLLRP